MYRSRKDGLALKSPTRKPLSVEELISAVMKMPQVTEYRSKYLLCKERRILTQLNKEKGPVSSNS